MQVRTLSVKAGKMTRTASAVPMPLPAAPVAETSSAPEIIPEAPAMPVARAGILGYLPARAIANPAPQAERQASAAPVRSRVRAGGWVIQVGAYEDEDEAKERLSTVKGKAARLLAMADPFTESVKKGGTTFYRARFAGLDKSQAEAR